jgi:hypothetical protein
VWGNPEDLNVALGVEVFNLFHQQDSRSTVSLESGLDIDFDPDRWQRWGIQGLRPDDANLLKFGEIFDVNNSWDSPRELRFSLRMKW